MQPGRPCMQTTESSTGARPTARRKQPPPVLLQRSGAQQRRRHARGVTRRDVVSGACDGGPPARVGACVGSTGGLPITEADDRACAGGMPQAGSGFPQTLPGVVSRAAFRRNRSAPFPGRSCGGRMPSQPTTQAIHLGRRQPPVVPKSPHEFGLTNFPTPPVASSQAFREWPGKCFNNECPDEAAAVALPCLRRDSR